MGLGHVRELRLSERHGAAKARDHPKLARPVCTLADGKKTALPIRDCADCGLLYYVHDVSECGTGWGTCPSCSGDEPSDRASWRKILLAEPFGQALINATEKWLVRANAVRATGGAS